MPGDSIREKVLQRIQNLLAAIQSGFIVEPSNALPEPPFLPVDLLNDQASVDEWVPSLQALTPELYTGPIVPFNLPGCMSLIKGSGGTQAALTRTFAEGFDATFKVGVMVFRFNDVNQIAVNNSVVVRFGTDASNYYEFTYNRSAFNSGQWGSVSVNIDGGASGGSPPVIIGNPDKTNIAWVQMEVKSVTGGTTFVTGDVLVDFVVLYDVTSWLPTGGASPPELIFDNQAVIGTFSVGFGHIVGADTNFGVEKTFGTGFDGTGGEVEAFIFIKDKSVYQNNPPLGFSAGILAGNDAQNWYGKFLFHSDLRDQVNDRGSGWNRIIFDPLTESDFIAGTPNITDLKWFTLGGAVQDASTLIPTGNIRIDFIRIIGVDGPYNHDIKKVYRYSISSQQTSGTPTMTMAALNEEQEVKLYPIIESKLIIGIDTEIELPSEALLDQELGRAQDDIQVALASQQELWGIARYIKVLNLEFHVREGTHTGILTTNIEVAFTFNQLDPTKQGV